MTYYQQPWGKLRIRERSCRLQVLDPVTTFEIEQPLIEHFGETLLMAVAAPDTVIAALGGAAVSTHGLTGTMAEAIADPDHGSDVAATALHLLSMTVTQAIMAADLDARWLTKTFEDVVFDRLKIDGVLIEDWQDWQRARMRPQDRWHIMAAQFAQTYRPLWVRSPYNVRSKKAKDYGVPSPKTPKAVQWASALAAQGYATPDEVLTRWTPARLIDVVESAAYAAENDARAHDAATAQGEARR